MDVKTDIVPYTKDLLQNTVCVTRVNDPKGSYEYGERFSKSINNKLVEELKSLIDGDPNQTTLNLLDYISEVENDINKL